MKYQLFALVLFTSLLGILSCQNGFFNDDAVKNREFIEDNFIGRWQIDSMKIVAHGFFKHEAIGIFADTTVYNYGEMNVDSWIATSNTAQNEINTSFTLSKDDYHYKLGFDYVLFSGDDINALIFDNHEKDATSEIYTFIEHSGLIDNVAIILESEDRIILEGLNRGVTTYLSR